MSGFAMAALAWIATSGIAVVTALWFCLEPSPCWPDLLTFVLGGVDGYSCQDGTYISKHGWSGHRVKRWAPNHFFTSTLASTPFTALLCNVVTFLWYTHLPVGPRHPQNDHCVGRCHFHDMVD